MHLQAFRGYTSLNEVEKKEICNGAGAKGDWRSKLIPNTMWGLSYREVFNIHDYAYYIGRTLQDKLDADMDMLCNMVTVTLCNGSGIFMCYLRLARAIKYFLAVHFKGREAFFKGKDTHHVLSRASKE